MTSKQPALVLDTNVWLDSFLGDRPGSAAATQLVGSATSTQSLLMYAITSLKDVFFLVARYLKQAELRIKGSVSGETSFAANKAAWGCIESMLEIGTPIAVDYSDAWLAAKLKDVHNDFEDNLIVAAFKRANADYLVTTDQQLLKHFPECTITPQDAVALFG